MDILIVEDKQELSSLLYDYFTDTGYCVKTVADENRTLLSMQENKAKLVLVDAFVVGMDVFSVCYKLRDIFNVPVLIINSGTTADDKLEGLFLSAEGYIEAPFDFDDLSNQVSNILKQRYENNILVEKDIMLDQTNRKVYLKNKEIDLSRKEFELLLLLMRNKGKNLYKEFIFKKVWGFDASCEPKLVNLHIQSLQKKIEEDFICPKYIKTVYGTGYRFHA